MATIARQLDALLPATPPVTGSPIAIVSRGGPTPHRRRVAVAAVAGYAFDGVDIMVLALALPYILKN